ncbi:hypothetical protein IKG73_01590 [Candidatus Saccharibacteria bacterium]|nr:hypothetical protein [Candidatus Saccharibacteria bacterium]
MKKNSSITPIIVIVSVILLGSLAVFLILNFLQPKPLDDNKAAEGEASNSSILEGEKERKEYPILAHLPIKNAVYDIGYQFEEDGTPTIVIDTTEFYLEFALKKLASLGTQDRPANSYRLRIVNWTGSEKEEQALKKFQSGEM